MLFIHVYDIMGISLIIRRGDLMRRFNVTGLCNPDRHYMVDITNKLMQIKDMIDYGDYFTVNRARQYGKTTTLRRLWRFLADDYIVVSISFEGWDDESFATSKNFCQTFLQQIKSSLKNTKESEAYQESWLDANIVDFGKLSVHIEKMCQNKKIVLMIDEVDKTSNNRVFLQFLGILRSKFLDREDGIGATFQSVILAGVYDIKNIKLEMIHDGIVTPLQTENHLRNSPWNIAVDFEVDMAFNADEISTMLVEYEKDYKTGMDVVAISEELFSYTSGYPFMVSRLCQIIHKNADMEWDVFGVRSAVTAMLRENNMLFTDMGKNLENHEDLYHLLYDVLILGLNRDFSYENPVIDMAYMYGYIKFNRRYSVVVFNKIFETRISNYFVTKNAQSTPHQKTSAIYHNIATDDYFNMELCLEKFAAFFNQDIFPTKEKKLLEIQYRISFLSYLKPLLNGIGHYHYESHLSDDRRIDLVVNYGRHEYLLELKRIFSERDREEGIKQLLGYMDGRGADVGYYLTFDFRKKAESKMEWLEIDGKRILEVNV